jgi:hypothetical protein
MKKSIFNVKAEELEERTVRFKISSEVVDRDGDILIAKGCNFDNFKKNPQFLGFHNYHEYPLGIPKNWGVDGKAVYCDVYFPTIDELSTNPAEASEKAKLVDFTYHCYKTGMLNAVSVGFIATDAEPNKETGGFIVKNWELLEFSAVTVPANQDAIAQAVKSFGDDEAKGMIDPIERLKQVEKELADCKKTIAEQTEKMNADVLELEDEKEIVFEDDAEINLDEIENTN